jgi:hypothetical protein
MSEVGQSLPNPTIQVTSAYPPGAEVQRTSPLVRFVPCVDGSGLARAFFTFCSIGRCSHVFGLLMRFT